MFQNLFKKGIAVTLATVLIIAPTNTTYAAEKFFVPNNPLTTQAPFWVEPFDIPENVSAQLALGQYSTQSNDVATIDDVKALAAEKTTMLTSMYGVTSVQYALIDNGVITISGQSGSYSNDFKATPGINNMYCIASVSKIFTTTCVMNLVEEGKVDLDKPVTTYIPDFTMADSRYKDITVRMLINHSSGLMGSTFHSALLYGDNDYSTTKNLLNTLKTQRLKAAPGAYSVYCNDGFTLAELLVERVTGASFSNYISETITKNLGMNDTNTPLDTFNQDKLAKVYYPGIKKTLPSDCFNAIGTGGIYSSAADLCKFSTIFMRNSASLLNFNSLTAMENKEYLRGLWSKDEDSVVGYGLGWDSVNTFPFNQYNIKALSKGGDSLHSHANFTVLPDHNMAIAVLSSGGSSSFNQIVAQEIMLAALKVKGAIPEIKGAKSVPAPIEASMPSELKEFSGYYSTMGTIFKIDLTDDGNLNIYLDSLEDTKPVQTYTYGGNGRFYSFSSSNSEYISFDKQSNGKVYLYSSAYSSLPGIGQTASSMYQAEKIVANPITKKVNNTWKKREDKIYYVLNEKYSSQLYNRGLNAEVFSMSKGIEGYIGNATIVDANHAQVNIQIPSVFGRDLYDISCSKKNDIEYINVNDSVYASEDVVKNLSTKSKFTCLIGKDGYARYYKITAKSAGKVLSVKVPKNAAFMVYNKDGSYVNNSYISGKKDVKLPKTGYVVFTGNVDSKFTVTYK